jgi:hypothetical protein
MSSELTVEQVADYILAAPNDQEFFNRADQYLTGHHTDLDRVRAIHARVHHRLKLLPDEYWSGGNPCNGPETVV